MAGVVSGGFELKDLPTIKTELEDALKARFGVNLDVSPQSPQGQEIGVHAEQIADLWLLAQECYNSFRPLAANDSNLSSLVKINGLVRIPDSPSTVDLRVSGTVGVVIPSGSRVKSADGIIFITISDHTIATDAADNDIQAASVDLGPVFAGANTLTTIDTPVTGWATVTNPSPATLGQLQETDTELRIRRESSVALNAVSVIDSIYANIRTIPGIEYLTIYENADSVPDVNGQSPYSIQAVVRGGDDEAIATAIFQKKPAGVPTYKTTVPAYGVTVPVMDSQGIPHNINFTRPEPVNIFVTVTTKVIDAELFPGDGTQQIADAIQAWANDQPTAIEVGEDVSYFRLSSATSIVAGHSVQSVQIGTTPSPTGTADINILYNQLANIQASNINVSIV